MLSSFLLPIFSLSLAASAAAELTILHPSSESWWVENAQNTFQTSGSFPSSYAARVYNTNTSLLPKEETLIIATGRGESVQAPPTAFNVNVSAPVFLKPGVNYTLTLSEIDDPTNIFVKSQPFEVRPQGSAYSSLELFNLTVPAANVTNPPTNPDGSSAVGAGGGASQGAAGERVAKGLLGFVVGVVGLSFAFAFV